jgi:hypothetical protein
MPKNRKRSPRPRNRRRIANPKVRPAVAKVPKLAVSPVSRILSEIVGDWGDSRLAELAARIAAEPFDLSKFRDEILHRLDRAVLTARASGRRVKFLDHLSYPALATTLDNSTLRELRNCLLIPRVFDRDRELERKWLSPAGSPLRTHLNSAHHAEARMREIESQAEEDGTSTDTEEYRRLDRQFRDDMILAILSKWHPGKRKELLSGKPVKDLKRQPRRKMVAAKVAVFWVLRTRLSRKDASDRLIHQLTVLISAPDQGLPIGDYELFAEAEALRKDLADDPAEWESLLDLP